MTEPTLFDVPSVARSRRRDPITSVQAGQSVNAGAVEARILAMFEWRLTMTDDQLVAAMVDSHPPTVKSARSRLSKAGRLVAAGVGVSARGKSMTRWKLA